MCKHKKPLVEWRKIKATPFCHLPSALQREIQRTWIRDSAKGMWREVKNWAFYVRKDGDRSASRYIEPSECLG